MQCFAQNQAGKDGFFFVGAEIALPCVIDDFFGHVASLKKLFTQKELNLVILAYKDTASGNIPMENDALLAHMASCLAALDAVQKKRISEQTIYKIKALDKEQHLSLAIWAKSYWDAQPSVPLSIDAYIKQN